MQYNCVEIGYATTNDSIMTKCNLFSTYFLRIWYQCCTYIVKNKLQINKIHNVYQLYSEKFAFLFLGAKGYI